MTYLSGVHVTEFGKYEGIDAWQWQEKAASAAVADAGLEYSDIDAVITGYATTAPHLMPANALSDRLGIQPAVAFGMSVGGATGIAMLAQAAQLVNGGSKNVLVVAGENRSTGQSRAASTAVLADVGNPDFELPLGANIPAYYALLASWYLNHHGLDEQALDPLSVQMREHAAATPGAHFGKPITAEDVRNSRIVATPLRLLHCCPVSDGGAAFVVSAKPQGGRSIKIKGTGQAHQQQYLTSLQNPGVTGAGLAAERALKQANVSIEDVDVFGIYDSFAITLALILEEIGLVPQGQSGKYAAQGELTVGGRFPLNTHGGLLSYGHSGVAGGMAHVVEVVKQLRGEQGPLQVADPTLGYVHADGGVMSAHVGVVLERT